jgi:serine/threonine protein kinase
MNNLNGKHVIKLHQGDKRIMYDGNYNSHPLLNFFKDPEKTLQSSDTIWLKIDRGTMIAKIVIEGQPWIVKRYNIKNFWHRLRRCFRKTRAATAWESAHLLSFFNIPTPKPIAYIEQHFLRWRGPSYLITQYIDAPDILDFFSENQNNERQFKSVAESLTHVFTNLKALHISHGDLKGTNILVSNEKIILIDLDGTRRYKTLFFFRRVWAKDMRRFMKNWKDNIFLHALFQTLVDRL